MYFIQLGVCDPGRRAEGNNTIILWHRVVPALVVVALMATPRYLTISLRDAVG